MIMEREQYHKWISEQKAPCILCNAHVNPFVLKDLKHWVWLGSIAPYWEYHSLLVPKRHVEKPSELKVSELMEGLSFLDTIVPKLNAANLTWRDGELVVNWWFMWRYRHKKGTNEGNRTIDHLHVHILPDRDHHIDPMICYEAFIPRKEKIVEELHQVGSSL